METEQMVSVANFVDLAIHLVVDLVAVTVLGYVVYYRRHRRRDLLTCLVCFNVSMFVVLSVIDLRSTSLGVGFGLFALLSIISLRSTPFSTVELAYFFSAIVIGVVNGLEVGGGVLNISNELFAMLLTVVLLLTVTLVDSPRLQRASGHQQITLDRLHNSPAELLADLESRLDAKVTTATVLHSDYVQQTMLIDVRYDLNVVSSSPVAR